jgi:soluble lytic murein transglycosylase-like protein
MGTPADTLVQKHPTIESQLLGPVFAYLKKGMPYNRNPQDLYMQVFYPAARKWFPGIAFPAIVQKQNPGIATVQDYVSRVEKTKVPMLSTKEKSALNLIAKKLDVTADSLAKLIAFESRFDPQAKNRITGARGLIQFMPNTAAWLGFGVEMPMLGLLAAGAILWYILYK